MNVSHLTMRCSEVVGAFSKKMKNFDGKIKAIIVCVHKARQYHKWCYTSCEFISRNYFLDAISLNISKIHTLDYDIVFFTNVCPNT